VLEHHHRIRVQITQIDAFAFPGHLGVLAQQEPTDVTEEEAAVGVVRVGVCFRVLVVAAVVT